MTDSEWLDNLFVTIGALAGQTSAERRAGAPRLPRDEPRPDKWPGTEERRKNSLLAG